MNKLKIVGQIRPEFLKYLQSLGFTNKEIIPAYLEASKHNNSSDYTITEVICRDILQGNTDYLRKENN